MKTPILSKFQGILGIEDTDNNMYFYMVNIFKKGYNSGKTKF